MVKNFDGESIREEPNKRHRRGLEDNIKIDIQGNQCERVKDSSGSGLGQLAGSWERGVGCSSTKKEISRLHEEKLTFQEKLCFVDIPSYLTTTSGRASSLSKLHDYTQDTPHSVGLLWTADQLVAETNNSQHSQDTNPRGGIRTRNPSKTAAADPFPK
jgi:hypothetical protein